MEGRTRIGLFKKKGKFRLIFDLFGEKLDKFSSPGSYNEVSLIILF